ncbi:MAG TPA: hypothetical protein VM286_09215 [Candidatus Thermoplasmatota archaeon]|nr:hypothetical protein [Candidatus Thermoplasmatota archaeon]
MTTALFLFTGLALVALGTPAMAAPVCDGDDDAADCNNNGTVKVHTEGDIGEMENDPHVDCPFYVEGFNMDAEHGTIVIKSWPPTGDKTVVLEDTYTADDQTEDSHHFLNGPYSLPSGHYKLFVSDEQHEKMKVFWVECEESTPTGTETTPPGTETTPPGTETGPSTEIPVFPSVGALMIGTVGALGGSLLMLRRRL